MARIAVVDDDLDFQQLMQDVLHEFGWIAVSCTTMQAAYTTLRTAPPDVVLLDIRLGGTLAGWEVLTYMQAHADLKRVPVIICSAMADELVDKRDWLDAHDIGALSKPFDLARLQQMIEERLPVHATALEFAV